MKSKTYNTAIYARLYREDGDKAESNSIVSQRAICEEFIAKNPELKLVKEFSDDGYSGVNFDRPNFLLMEQDIRNGKINCVVCKDLSRFSRNYIEAGRYLEKIFPQLGVRFIAINDAYDSTSGNPQLDSFIIPFKNLINDTYCKDISVKIRTNLDVKRRSGEYVGAFAPYGYVKDPNDKRKLIIDEYAAGIVRSIFAMYKDGLSIGAIADRPNSRGVLSPLEYRTSQGSNYKTHDCAKWAYSAVQRILTNEIYIGVLAQGKTGTPNYKVRKWQFKDESEWIKVENAHEPTVSYTDFMAVKEMMKRDRRSCADSENGLFSGFLFCGDCGETMVRKTVPSKGKKYVYYVCAGAKRGNCKSHSISEKELQRVVLNSLQSQISLVLDLEQTLEYIDKLPSADRKIFNFDTQIAKIEEEIERAQKMKLRLYEDLADGVITKAEYAEFKQNYSDTIERKKEALLRVKQERDSAAAVGATERSWVTLFREHENLEALNRRALMAMVDRIFVYENHVVEIRYKYHDEYLQALRYAEQLKKAV